MKVFIEGFIYKYQMHGGVTRIINETLPRLCNLDPALSIEIVTLEDNLQPVPAFPGISSRIANYTEFKGLRPRTIWRHIEPTVNRHRSNRSIFEAVGSGGGAIWHTAYYRLPGSWDGPIITTILDMAYQKFPDLFTSATHRWRVRNMHNCIQRSDMVICISDATCQDVLQFGRISVEKTAVIHLAPSDIFHQPAPALASYPFMLPENYLLHLGNRSLNKNFDLLLRAYADWPGRVDFPLVVVGRFWNEHEQKRIHALGVDKNIVHLDFQNDHVLASLYHGATAFIFPSLYEGFGIPLLEAMACECPLVASRIPTTLEVAGDIPIYFEPTSPEDLQTALDQALSEGRNSARTRAGKLWSQKYSWEETARRTLAVYQQLGEAKTDRVMN